MYAGRAAHAEDTLAETVTPNFRQRRQITQRPFLNFSTPWTLPICANLGAGQFHTKGADGDQQPCPMRLEQSLSTVHLPEGKEMRRRKDDKGALLTWQKKKRRKKKRPWLAAKSKPRANVRKTRMLCAFHEALTAVTRRRLNRFQRAMETNRQ